MNEILVERNAPYTKIVNVNQVNVSPGRESFAQSGSSVSLPDAKEFPSLIAWRACCSLSGAVFEPDNAGANTTEPTANPVTDPITDNRMNVCGWRTVADRLAN